MSTLVNSPQELIEVLLKNRGLKTKKDIEEFFNPDLNSYKKDLELDGIEGSKKRILKAIENKELIVVYGDYDVDGLCSTAIMYHGLVSLGAKVLPYIPHREKEGYGLSKLGLDEIKKKDAGLVITVDNGIVATDAAAYAKKLGLDLIITDHHLKGDKKPKALSIVHSTTLCGAGVAWCLTKNLVDASLAEELLDLVTIATICDMVPLVDVNRALVTLGLKLMQQNLRLGIKSLALECKLDLREIDSFKISYILGPRLNAVGRLDSAMDGLRLLCTKDPLKARELARKLCEINDQKKLLIEEAIIEARSKVGDEKNILVLASDQWIPGITGLIASRICEEYKLPTIAISTKGGLAKGSARSVNGLDIVGVLRQCSDLLIDIGGHPKAAGFSLQISNISKLKDKIEEVVSSQKLEVSQEKEIEGLVNLKKVNLSWIKILDKFEPFGVGNPKPILGGENVRVTDLKTVGGGKHLKFKSDGVDSIAFGMGDRIIKEGQLINLSFNLEVDNFSGYEKPQLKVYELALAE